MFTDLDVFGVWNHEIGFWRYLHEKCGTNPSGHLPGPKSGHEKLENVDFGVSGASGENFIYKLPINRLGRPLFQSMIVYYRDEILFMPHPPVLGSVRFNRFNPDHGFQLLQRRLGCQAQSGLNRLNGLHRTYKLPSLVISLRHAWKYQLRYAWCVLYIYIYICIYTHMHMGPYPFWHKL